MAYLLRPGSNILEWRARFDSTAGDTEPPPAPGSGHRVYRRWQVVTGNGVVIAWQNAAIPGGGGGGGFQAAWAAGTNSIIGRAL